MDAEFTGVANGSNDDADGFVGVPKGSEVFGEISEPKTSKGSSGGKVEPPPGAPKISFDGAFRAVSKKGDFIDVTQNEC